MKRFIGIALMVAIVALAWTATSQTQEPRRTASFMRLKLKHTQAALEGLVTEDYRKVHAAAGEIGLLSLDEAWNVIQTEEYVQQSLEFQRVAAELAEQAKKKNLDGATLAYVSMTMQCVKCHKHVRGIRVAGLSRPAGSPAAE